MKVLPAIFEGVRWTLLLSPLAAALAWLSTRPDPTPPPGPPTPIIRCPDCEARGLSVSPVSCPRCTGDGWVEGR